ncbi:MAG TPA: hypothetical protein VFM54_11990, partial [Micromonosporaceae bacterium]|nr:hypothetical protein [Micromonosporaceae bacterium]
MAEANLGAKLEYFFGNATGSAYNIQQSGEMATTLNRIGILDNPAGRSLFETHLRQTFADPESVVAVQD